MSTQIEAIRSPEVPAPGGHYSHAAAWSDLVFVSGQLPVRQDGVAATLGFDAQVRQAMSNLLAILRTARCEAHDILKVTAYIVGIEHWARFNSIYAEVMGAAVRPARAVVPVPALHHGYLIEIEAVARRPEVRE